MINSKFLFVVGVGRSGTSLLQSMFAANPSMVFMPETAFVRRYLATGCLGRLHDKQGKSAVIECLSNDEAFSRSRLDISELDRSVFEPGQSLELSIYRQMIQAHTTTDTSWVGDKDPRMIEFLPLLSSLFSNPTVVHIIRDPRDVLLSKKKAAWSRKGHVWKHIFANRVQLKLGRMSGQRVLGLNYHEVIYEDLISSPHRVLSTLCEEIGLPFHDAMLAFGEAAKKLVSESELSWKKETIGPLLPENKEKWKAGLDDREIVLTEICCQEAFRVGGYRLDDRKPRLSVFDKLWIVSGAAVIFVADWPYRLFRNYRVWRACK